MTKKRKIWLGVGAALFVIVGAAVWYVLDVYLWVRDVGLLDEPERVEWAADSAGNLEAIHVALMQYHTSEGHFPSADGWMDGIAPYMQTRDLAEGEHLKKLRRPDLSEGEWGYAFNEAASLQYVEDITHGENMPIVFESTSVEWNAHGTVDEALRPAAAITLGGSIKTVNSGDLAPAQSSAID